MECAMFMLYASMAWNCVFRLSGIPVPLCRSNVDSTLYFVWEHRMSNRDNWYSSGWGSNLDRMWGLPATNTFMIKMNYWFNL